MASSLRPFNPDVEVCEDCGEELSYKPYNYNSEPLLCQACYFERMNKED